jgi:hypothetical protein
MSKQAPAPPPSFDEMLRRCVDEITTPLRDELASVRRELELVKKGLDEWVTTKEALRITGIERRETLQKRAVMQDTLIESKQEGNRHYYLRSSLVAYLEANPPRRYRSKRIPLPTAA